MMEQSPISMEGTVTLAVLTLSITMLKATAYTIDLHYDSDDRLIIRKFAMLLRNNTINELVNMYSIGFT
jgi:hypothetical protein